MGMNGRIGRAKVLRKIKRDTERAAAAAAGVDVSDRAALKQWKAKRWQETYERIMRNSGKDIADWK